MNTVRHGFLLLTHSFPMHPFSTPFQGVEKGCIGNEWIKETFLSQMEPENNVDKVHSCCYQERQSCWAFNKWPKWKVCENCIFFLRADTINSAKAKITGKPINDGKGMGLM